MKRWAVTALVVAGASLALVMAMGFSSESADAEDMCASMADAGRAIMVHRQEGKPMSDVIDSANKAEHAPAREGVLAMVELAYSQPIQPDAAARENAAASFGDSMRSMCLKWVQEVEDEERQGEGSVAQ